MIFRVGKVSVGLILRCTCFTIGTGLFVKSSVVRMYFGS